MDTKEHGKDTITIASIGSKKLQRINKPKWPTISQSWQPKILSPTPKHPNARTCDPANNIKSAQLTRPTVKDKACFSESINPITSGLPNRTPPLILTELIGGRIFNNSTIQECANILQVQLFGKSSLPYVKSLQHRC